MEQIDYGFMNELLETETREQFTINNDNLADWAVKKVLDSEEESNRLIAIGRQQIADINKKISDIQSKSESKQSFLKEKLFEYFESVEPSKATKTQSTYQLFSGRLIKKKQQPTYEKDEESMLAWARVNTPAFVEIKESLAWGELKKQTDTQGENIIYKETGEVIPGIKAVEREDKFEIKAC